MPWIIEEWEMIQEGRLTTIGKKLYRHMMEKILKTVEYHDDITKWQFFERLSTHLKICSNSFITVRQPWNNIHLVSLFFSIERTDVQEISYETKTKLEAIKQIIRQLTILLFCICWLHHSNLEEIKSCVQNQLRLPY